VQAAGLPLTRSQAVPDQGGHHGGKPHGEGDGLHRKLEEHETHKSQQKQQAQGEQSLQDATPSLRGLRQHPRHTPLQPPEVHDLNPSAGTAPPKASARIRKFFA
jgi:hypothetical protein